MIIRLYQQPAAAIKSLLDQTNFNEFPPQVAPNTWATFATNMDAALVTSQHYDPNEAYALQQIWYEQPADVHEMFEKSESDYLRHLLLECAAWLEYSERGYANASPVLAEMWLDKALSYLTLAEQFAQAAQHLDMLAVITTITNILSKEV